jgi:hypothetical protein
VFIKGGQRVGGQALELGVFALLGFGAGALVSKSAGLSLNDAIGTLLNSDAAFYGPYWKQDSTPAPTFGSELLSSQMDEFYDMTGALLRTMAGILDSSAQDKGPQIAGALGEFTATRIEGAQAIGQKPG